jgi:hypothetical protein
MAPGSIYAEKDRSAKLHMFLHVIVRDKYRPIWPSISCRLKLSFLLLVVVLTPFLPSSYSELLIKNENE